MSDSPYGKYEIRSPELMPSMDSDGFEDWWEANVLRNRKFLDLFTDELIDARLKTKTIEQHLSNVEVFLDMMARREGELMEEAIPHVWAYLGDWYIRRCMWSTPANIKTTAASIKKFAEAMKKYGFISETDYKNLCQTIKTDMPEWQATCRRYNDPNEDMDFEDFVDF